MVRRRSLGAGGGLLGLVGDATAGRRRGDVPLSERSLLSDCEALVPEEGLAEGEGLAARRLVGRPLRVGGSAEA